MIKNHGKSSSRQQRSHPSLNESATTPKAVSPHENPGATSLPVAITKSSRQHIASPVATTAKLPSPPNPHLNRDIVTGENKLPLECETLFTRREGYLYNLVTIGHRKDSKFGLDLIHHQNKVIVSRVEEDSLFFEYLFTADRIIAVNHQRVYNSTTTRETFLKAFKDHGKVDILIERPITLLNINSRLRYIFEFVHSAETREYRKFLAFHGFIEDLSSTRLNAVGDYYFCYSIGEDGKVHFFLVLGVDYGSGIQLLRYEIYFEDNQYVVGNYKFDTIRDMVIKFGLKKDVMVSEDDANTKLVKDIKANVLKLVPNDGMITPDLKVVKLNEYDIYKNYKECYEKCHGDLTLWIKSTDPSQIVPTDVIEIGEIQTKKSLQPRAAGAEKVGILKTGQSSSNLKAVYDPTKNTQHVIASDTEGKKLMNVPLKSPSFGKKKKLKKESSEMESRNNDRKNAGYGRTFKADKKDKDAPIDKEKDGGKDVCTIYSKKELAGLVDKAPKAVEKTSRKELKKNGTDGKDGDNKKPNSSMPSLFQDSSKGKSKDKFKKTE